MDEELSPTNSLDRQELKSSVKKQWADPELLLLSADKTQFALPDIADGGGPYS